MSPFDPSQKRPLVCIVGRPNVGKSTLFNRICKTHTSLVHKEEGLTRDRRYSLFKEGGRSFYIVDTGGLYSGERLEEKIKEQVLETLERAHVTLFVVDGKEGMTAADRMLAQFLRKKVKNILLVVNKVDEVRKMEFLKAEFWSLGFEPIPISAMHGVGVNELMKKVEELLPKEGVKERSAEEKMHRVCIVGRPNVGKSTLFNAIFGRSFSIVDEYAGTTTDTVEHILEWRGKKLLLIDTAGVRKTRRGSMQRLCVQKARKCAKEADVTLLLLDAKEGVSGEEKRLADYILHLPKALVLIVNKWDLLMTDKRRYLRYIKEVAPFLSFVPTLFCSAKEGDGVENILPTIERVIEQLYSKVSTHSLNKVLRSLWPEQILYGVQVNGVPPHYLLFVKRRSGFKVLNMRERLREALSLSVPIKIFLRERR